MTHERKIHIKRRFALHTNTIIVNFIKRLNARKVKMHFLGFNEYQENQI